MQDAGGFFDLILTEAANMANTVPEMFDPLAAIGMPVAPAGGILCHLSLCQVPPLPYSTISLLQGAALHQGM